MRNALPGNENFMSKWIKALLSYMFVDMGDIMVFMINHSHILAHKNADENSTK